MTQEFNETIVITHPATLISHTRSRATLKKRIFVCCDGTWEDGILKKERSKYTNILRLARAINHADERLTPPISQIVYYQPGMGAAPNMYDEVVNVVGVGDKVEEAYAFIAQNYVPGDEVPQIFLFGFSRGAYTARMVADFIGAIGVLNRTDMDHFGDIFLALQKRGKTNDQDEIEALDKHLAPWTSPDSPGKQRADSGAYGFSVKCVGVFDTVGHLGLPGELILHSEKARALYGFRDKLLGEHIERAFQALALNEARKDFDCTKFEQTETGRQKHQVLKQCWFTGSHSDIGGGYEQHDLSDLTLTWMAANIQDIVSLDTGYLASLLDPVAPWGEQKPHDSITGIFRLADTIQRTLPTSTNEVTHETIHPSVLRQKDLYPALTNDLEKNFLRIVSSLLPLEEEVRSKWLCNGVEAA
ncbi:hypothetical protein BKA93DRAFT_842602 [Sparassis latifolia]